MEVSAFYQKNVVDNFEKSLLLLDRVAVRKVLLAANDEIPPIRRIEALVIPALENIGNKWTTGEVSLSQVYMSGKICEEMVDLVLPPADPARRDSPPMAITVLEDYHLLGKRIVYSCLRASGFELLNYPRMDVESLARSVVQDKIQILLISVLMFPSALRIKELRARLHQDGWRGKIGVGGAPFRMDSTLWQEVGADAFGYSAPDAVSMVQKFIGS